MRRPPRPLLPHERRSKIRALLRWLGLGAVAAIAGLCVWFFGFREEPLPPVAAPAGSAAPRPRGFSAAGIPEGRPGLSPHQLAVRDAMRAFHGRDFALAQRLLDKADTLGTPTALTINVRAAIAIEERRFDDGRRYCEQALRLEPKFFPARFNLAEIPFVQRRYAEARALYQPLLDAEPDNELVSFRIFMTHLLEGDTATARTQLDAMRFPSETGSYYYANAAWDFSQGNADGAREWIRSGDYVFTKEKNVYFSDVFYDLGWLQRGEEKTVAK